MASVGSYGNIGSEVSVKNTNTSVTISNIVIAALDVGVEQSLALPADTKEFMIRSRGQAQLQVSYTATESGTKYFTITKDSVYNDTNFYSSQTIYFQADKADTIEVVAYHT